jgi:hypothetical protein
MPVIERADFDLAKQFISGDIRREIVLAAAWHDVAHPERRRHLEDAQIQPSGGGNLLCALGLLCYTEFCGYLKFDERQDDHPDRAASRKNFNAFFRWMGQGYADLLDAGHDVYVDFRCGMAHAYFAKPASWTILMPGVGNHAVGIECDANGHYSFIVERYHVDLAAALDRLDADLTAATPGPNGFPLTRPDR